MEESNEKDEINEWSDGRIINPTLRERTSGTRNVVCNTTVMELRSEAMSAGVGYNSTDLFLFVASFSFGIDSGSS